MKNLFPGYYRPSNDEFKQIWQEAIFVFDTNILLNIYRWPESASSDFWKVLEKISDRIWLPHQVALEYQKNRLSIILEQKNKYSEVKNIFNESIILIEKKIKDLNLRKRHSEINPDKTIQDLNKIIQDYIATLDISQNNFDTSYQNDDTIRSKIENLFEGNIGDMLSKEELDVIYKSAQSDYTNGKPPGFKDIGKGEIENYYINGEKIIAKYGDVILWKQILKEFTNRKGVKSVIFITDDVKEDWWWIEKSSGKRTIGPRPELIEEIKSVATIDNFYMYNSDRFLKYAKDFLSLNIKNQTIESVKDLQEDFQNESLNRIIRNSEKIIENINANYNEDTKESQIINRIIGKISEKINKEVLSVKPRDAYDFHLMKKNLFINLESDFVDLIEVHGQDLFRQAIEISLSRAYMRFKNN